MSFFKKSLFRSNRTYIVPTKFGFVFALICFVLFLMSFIYGNNVTYLLTFIMISQAVISMGITNRNTDKVGPTKPSIRDFFAHETGEAVIQIENNNPIDLFEIKISFLNNSSQVEKIEAQSTATTRIAIQNPQRGQHVAQKIKIESTFPYGLLRSWKNNRIEAKYFVYPSPQGNPTFPSAGAASDEGEITSIQNQGEFIQHRVYQNSDSFRRIDWRAYARSQKWLVQQKEEQNDGSLLFDIKWTLHIPDFEKRLQQLSLWIQLAEQKNRPYQLILGTWQSEVSLGLEHKTHCLRKLATIHEGDL